MLEIRDKLAIEYSRFLNDDKHIRDKLYPPVVLPREARDAGSYWGFYHGFTKALELMNEQRRLQGSCECSCKRVQETSGQLSLFGENREQGV